MLDIFGTQLSLIFTEGGSAWHSAVTENNAAMSSWTKEKQCKAFALHCGEEQTDYLAAMMIE